MKARSRPAKSAKRSSCTRSIPTTRTRQRFKVRNRYMAETKQISVPDIGNFKDVNVVEVLVKAGDKVNAEDSLITLETDKAAMDVPSQSAGVVKEVKVKAGDKVSQGSVILMLESGDAADAPAAQPAAAVASPAFAAQTPNPSRPPLVRGGEGAAPSPDLLPPDKGGMGGLGRAGEGLAHASPAIRRFARELGVDLAQVKGSGEKGRVTRDDVQNFVKAALAQREGGGEASGYPPAYSLPVLPMPQIDFAQFGAVETRPLARTRKLSGATLHRNWVSIPHVTQFEEA